MSDAKDAVAKAVARLKQLAATRLMEKQDLESRLAKLPEGDPGAGELAAELAAADSDYRGAMAEIAELKGLARQAEAAEARGVVDDVDAGLDDTDPFIKSDEDLALDNVRDHLRSLQSQVTVAEELARNESPTMPEIPAAKKQPTREERDTAARADFEALRAKRGVPAAAPDDKTIDEAALDEPPPSPPKKPRTM